MRYLVIYASTAAIFFVIDMIWLGVVARNVYRDQLGDLLLPQPHWPVALAFYALYVAGLVAFVVGPAHASGASLAATFGWAFFFGLIAYATYDLTNLATLRGWPIVLTFVDMAWGAVLSGSAATGGLWLARRVLG